jgi:hypothetical protein
MLTSEYHGSGQDNLAGTLARPDGTTPCLLHVLRLLAQAHNARALRSTHRKMKPRVSKVPPHILLLTPCPYCLAVGHRYGGIAQGAARRYSRKPGQLPAQRLAGPVCAAAE